MKGLIISLLSKIVIIGFVVLISSCSELQQEYDPPSEVLEYAYPYQTLSEQGLIAKSCKALNNISGLKLLMYDNLGIDPGFASATAILWQGKTVYITNRHNVVDRTNFFLIDIDGNWVEVRVVKTSGNVFGTGQKEDDLSNEIAIDLALLEPLSSKPLNVDPQPLYTGKLYNGTVATIGYPNGSYGWSKSQAFSKEDYLVLYDENPFYSLPGTSGGGVFDCDTGLIVGLTFATPGFFVVVNPETKQFRTIKTANDLKFGYFVAQYAIHASQIAKFLEE